jgi:hypothetical protein
MESCDPQSGHGQSRRGFLGLAGLLGVGVTAAPAVLAKGASSAVDSKARSGAIVPAHNLLFGTASAWRPVSLVVTHP